MNRFSPQERVVLAVDTSDKSEAVRFARLARAAGSRFIKLGLELQSATSWDYCSRLAKRFDLEWIADAKIDDIANTSARTAHNIVSTKYRPFGITMHSRAGVDSMRAVKEVAGDTVVFGVTELTSIPQEETEQRYEKSRTEVVHNLALELSRVGLGGVVASPQDIATIKGASETRHLLTLIPGTRSDGALADDQPNRTTAGEAVKQGADLIVVGREVTKAADPYGAYDAIIREVAEAQGVKIAVDTPDLTYDAYLYGYGFVRGIPPMGGYRWR